MNLKNYCNIEEEIIMKKVASLLLVLMLSVFCTIGMTGCADDYDDSSYDSSTDSSYDSDYDSSYDSDYDSSYDSDYDSSYDSDYSGGSSSGTSLEDYDYNGNGEMETNEFQDATNDFMDENGF